MNTALIRSRTYRIYRIGTLPPFNLLPPGMVEEAIRWELTDCVKCYDPLVIEMTVSVLQGWEPPLLSGFVKRKDVKRQLWLYISAEVLDVATNALDELQRTRSDLQLTQMSLEAQKKRADRWAKEYTDLSFKNLFESAVSFSPKLEALENAQARVKQLEQENASLLERNRALSSSDKSLRDELAQYRAQNRRQAQTIGRLGHDINRLRQQLHLRTVLRTI